MCAVARVSWQEAQFLPDIKVYSVSGVCDVTDSEGNPTQDTLTEYTCNKGFQQINKECGFQPFKKKAFTILS